MATAEVPPQVEFYAQTLKALRDDLHANRRNHREQLELLREHRDFARMSLELARDHVDATKRLYEEISLLRRDLARARRAPSPRRRHRR